MTLKRNWIPDSLILFFQDIRLSHSIFALPFAAVGFLLSGAEMPGFFKSLLLLVCMITARSFAMGANRFLDRHIDRKNPRTAGRLIPSGQLASIKGLGWTLFMGLLFVISASLLNPLSGQLSVPLLVILAFYSFMKRISFLTHWYLGLCLGLAPVAVCVSLTGTVNIAVILTAVAVTFWTAGFDILYSLQDIDFDKQEFLHSIPARTGVAKSITISPWCFGVMIASLTLAGISSDSGGYFYLGVFLVALILVAEQWIVRNATIEIDNIQINKAFFTVNGWVSVVFYCMVQIDYSYLLP